VSTLGIFLYGSPSLSGFFVVGPVVVILHFESGRTW
jgi:hypothetical protein